MAKIDLTNVKKEYYTVLSKNEEKSRQNRKNVFWNCKCKCGKIFTATTTDINRNKVKSCGCMRKQLIGKAHLQDITNQQFGNLLVLGRDSKDFGNKQSRWLCKCKCGNIISVEKGKLTSVGQISCGCIKSIGEYNINKILSSNGIKYISQYTNEDLKTKKDGYLRFDFAILDNNNNIIRLIEFDGPQHQNQDNYFQDFNLQKRDQLKNKYAHDKNIPLIRIPYSKRDCLTLKDLIGEEK